MSLEISFPNLDEVLAKLDPKIIAGSMRKGFLRGLIQLQTVIQRDKLSGQVLKNQTGTLRRSIHYRINQDEVEGLSGYVGSFAGYVSPGGQYAASYARIHEYGGTFTIPAHTRRVGLNREGDVTKLLTYGGAIRKSVAYVGESIVKEHTATFPERSFLRSALREQTEMIKREMLSSLSFRLAS